MYFDICSFLLPTVYDVLTGEIVAKLRGQVSFVATLLFCEIKNVCIEQNSRASWRETSSIGGGNCRASGREQSSIGEGTVEHRGGNSRASGRGQSSIGEGTVEHRGGDSRASGRGQSSIGEGTVEHRGGNSRASGRGQSSIGEGTVEHRGGDSRTSGREQSSLGAGGTVRFGQYKNFFTTDKQGRYRCQLCEYQTFSDIIQEDFTEK